MGSFQPRVSAVTKTVHERYPFRVPGRCESFDIPVVCSNRAARAPVPLAVADGDPFEGSVRLTTRDICQITLTVSTTMGRPGFFTDRAEMSRLDTSTVVVDLSLLSRHPPTPTAG
jgi:hypothetical protein